MSAPTGTDYGQEVHPPTSPPERTDVVSLSEYGKILLRWWALVAVCTLLGICLGCLAFVVFPRTYQAQVTLTLLPLPGQATTGSSSAAVNTNTEITYATTQNVANLAKNTLQQHFPAYASARPSHVTKKMTVKVPDANSAAITITYKAGSPEEAAEGANAVADAYITYRTEVAKQYVSTQTAPLDEQRKATLEAANQTNSALAALPDNAPRRATLARERDNQLSEAATLQSQINVLAGAPTNPAVITGRANPPTGPSFPKLPIFGMGGLVLGLLLGIVLALRREHKDDTVRGARDINRAGVGPMLASVRVPRRLPEGSGMALLTAPSSAEAQGYRLFAAKLQAPHLQVGGRLLFTGSFGGDTRVPFNLAIALSRMGNRVLLIASPQALLETFSPLGLTESALLGVGYHGQHVGVALVGLPDLQLAPLRDEDMPTTNYLIDHAGELVDYVLVDDASSPAAWRTLALSTVVDGVYVVAMLGRGGRRSLKRLAQELGSVRARIMGTVVLLGSKVPAPPATMKGAAATATAARRGSARSASAKAHGEAAGAVANSEAHHPSSPTQTSTWATEVTSAQPVVTTPTAAASSGPSASSGSSRNQKQPQGQAPSGWSAASSSTPDPGEGTRPTATSPAATGPSPTSGSTDGPTSGHSLADSQSASAQFFRAEGNSDSGNHAHTVSQPQNGLQGRDGFQATASTAWPGGAQLSQSSPRWGGNAGGWSGGSNSELMQPRTTTLVEPAASAAVPNQSSYWQDASTVQGSTDHQQPSARSDSAQPYQPVRQSVNQPASSQAASSGQPQWQQPDYLRGPLTSGWQATPRPTSQARPTDQEQQ